MQNMATKSTKIRQLSEQLKKGKPLPLEKVGYMLKEIRKTLGMTQKQMAKKLNISRQAVTKLEKKMQTANIKTLEKYASMLECHILFAVVSETGIEKIIERQAKKTALRILGHSYANMALEKQSPGKKAWQNELKELIGELSLNPDSSLWED